MKKLSLLAATALVAAASTSVQAAEATSLEDALLNGDASLSLRYRFENVDSDAAAHTQDSSASTLRTRLGYTTGTYKSLAATIEFEDVSVIGEDSYNDGKNGKTTRPLVADAPATELNQVYIDYTAIPDTLIRIGRQNVNFDNQRHIGTVDWRQNNQNYDAAVLVNSSIPDTTVIYGFVGNVNRINGDNLDTETHLVNISYSGLSFGKLVGYAYLLDLDAASLSSLDSNTYGVRFDGGVEVAEGTKLVYTAEYANQKDAADNATDYSADYYNINAGVAFGGLTVRGGYEVLGSDNSGSVAFTTALATLHAQNGWADQFMTTPTAGLEDISASISYAVDGTGTPVDGTKIDVIYHDFSSDYGSTDFGDEINARITKKFGGHYSASLKYANFDADSGSGYDDIEKLWVTLAAEF